MEMYLIILDSNYHFYSEKIKCLLLRKTGKKIIHFYNNSGNLDNVIQFLEDVQKKINYLSLNVSVEGNTIKIILFGSRDLQHLATERLKDLANRYL